MSLLDPDLLLRAYAAGVFPMADSRDADEVYWVEPRRRGILPLDGFRMARSLARTVRSDRYAVTADRDFAGVLAACAAATEDRPDTWINPQIEHAYGVLHARGQAHSLEVWAQDGTLAGGLYGVSLGGAFFGESMFSRSRDASKVALAHLVTRLRVGDYRLLDCQFITAHLASLGAIEIGRKAYAALLGAALGAVSPDGSAAGDFGLLDRREGVAPPPAGTVAGPISGWRIVQLLGQTS